MKPGRALELRKLAFDYVVNPSLILSDEEYFKRYVICIESTTNAEIKYFRFYVEVVMENLKPIREIVEYGIGEEVESDE